MDQPIVISFNYPLDTTTVSDNIELRKADTLSVDYSTYYLNERKNISLRPIKMLESKTHYTLVIKDGLKGSKGETLPGASFRFKTQAGTLKIQSITLNGTDPGTYSRVKGVDFQTEFVVGFNEPLEAEGIENHIQLSAGRKCSAQYFWVHTHPVSGLAHERASSVERVTSGGSGFGLMAILVGIERGFIGRDEGIQRLAKILHFLEYEADRFHGAWPHWLNGSTGEVMRFSEKDDGAIWWKLPIWHRGCLRFANTSIRHIRWRIQ